MASDKTEPTTEVPNRLIGIELDASLAGGASADVEHERQVAIFDLLEDNRFDVVGDISGPYRLTLSITDKRLVFDMTTDAGTSRAGVVHLSMTPFRRIVRDYFMVCETYYDAIRSAPHPRAASRPSIWVGGACTMRAARCCSTGWMARSKWILPLHGDFLPSSAHCIGRVDPWVLVSPMEQCRGRCFLPVVKMSSARPWRRD